MEIKYLVTLCGIGDIGHQVDLAGLQCVQALLPRARDVLKLPFFPGRNALEHIDQQARGFPGRVCEDLGLVGVNAHPHVPCLGTAREDDEAYAANCAEPSNQPQLFRCI